MDNATVLNSSHLLENIFEFQIPQKIKEQIFEITFTLSPISS